MVCTFMLRKDPQRGVRVVVDYRGLNDLSKKCAYPLPRIDSCLESLGGNYYYISLDHLSGFYQIELDERDREKTAFGTSRDGLYQYVTMPQGLTGAPHTFQRCMELVFKNIQWRTMIIYMDDICTFAESFDQALFRRFIKGFSARASPLNRLTEAGRAFIWGPEQDRAFMDLKFALTGEEVLAYPKEEGLFIVDTDSSNFSCGGCLSQMQWSGTAQDFVEKPIMFASKSFDKTQRRYCATRRELLGEVLNKDVNSMLDEHVAISEDAAQTSNLGCLKQFNTVNCSPLKMAKLQRADPDLGIVIQWFEENRRPLGDKEYVQLHIKRCEKCAFRKRPKNIPRAPLTEYTDGHPMDRIQTDIMGPLNETESGYRYIIVVIDGFTKWAECYATRDQLASTVAHKTVQMYMNFCPDMATGFTPNYLMMGREAIIPVDISLGCITENKISSVDDAIQLQEKLTEAHQIARTNLQKNAVRQKRDYDTRISKTHFSKGQLVLCLEKSRHKGISKKIDPNIWKGPYVITRKITDLLYEIRL
ncbi:uncharacterized protein LOC128549364 [Mercenaria mercenaria]|uniref:uncharacterized protein LOC128549364 n=1 Tax=Mercenaria mercenaria TaxID=6596 RepID=UPI00234EFE0E|nr:uncharacterized protein LOC128549364 [Mercenaria mercenaria]